MKWIFICIKVQKDICLEHIWIIIVINGLLCFYREIAEQRRPWTKTCTLLSQADLSGEFHWLFLNATCSLLSPPRLIRYLYLSCSFSQPPRPFALTQTSYRESLYYNLIYTTVLYLLTTLLSPLSTLYTIYSLASSSSHFLFFIQLFFSSFA